MNAATTVDARSSWACSMPAIPDTRSAPHGTPRKLSAGSTTTTTPTSRSSSSPAERLVHGVGVDGFAVAVGEHPRLVVGDADRRELGGLKRPPTGEDGEGRVVEGDCPAGVSGLAAGLVDLVANGDEPTVEVKALLGEVDVGS